MRGLHSKHKRIWFLAVCGLPVCWWLQPVVLPEILLLLLLLLLSVVTVAVPVGRMGARTVRFGGAVALFATLLYGAVTGSALVLIAGLLAHRYRRDRNDILLYAPAVAVSAQLVGCLYHTVASSGLASPIVAQRWLLVVVAAVLFSLVRIALLWWGDTGRRTHRKQILGAEIIVDGVTFPAIMAALSVQREWGSLSVVAFCTLGVVGLLSARAFIEAHLAQRQVRALQAMHQRLIAHLHPDHLLQDLGNGLQRLLPFDRLSLWSYARQEAHLQIVGTYPQNDRSAFPAYVNVEGILDKAIDHAKPMVFDNDLRERCEGFTKHFDGHLFIIPLAAHNYLWGLLVLERKPHREPFVKADYELIRVLVEHLAILLENMRLYRQTMDLAIRDGLTGLLNHRRLLERLQEETSRSLRYYHPMTLLMIDVDYFKRYNDTYGHQQGDEVLRILAKILQQNIRRSDIVGRYGGEEFVIVLPETRKEAAVVLAQRLCEIVAATPFPGYPGGPSTRCTISIGVATYPEDGFTVSDLVAAADAALYRAKRFGKNRVVVAS